METIAIMVESTLLKLVKLASLMISTWRTLLQLSKVLTKMIRTHLDKQEIKSSKEHSLKLNNIKRNTQKPMKFLMTKSQILWTGVVMVDMISPLISETKVNVDLATLFHSLRLWRPDLSSNMVNNPNKCHHRCS